MPTELPKLLDHIGAKPSVRDVHLLVRSGSRVYGCAGPDSDEDFVAVVGGTHAERDLVFFDGINIILHTDESFQAALDEHNILALECFFCPPEHVLHRSRKPFRFRLDKLKVQLAATEKSDADFKKAEKLFAAEPGPSKKKLYHSLRVLMFAIEIAREGRLDNFGAANEVWEDIQTRGDDWAQFEDLVRLRDHLRSALAATGT